LTWRDWMAAAIRILRASNQLVALEPTGGIPIQGDRTDLVFAGLTICFLMDIINTSTTTGFVFNTKQWAGIKPIFPQILIPASRRVPQDTYVFLAVAGQYDNTLRERREARRRDLMSEGPNFVRTRNFDIGGDPSPS
jgi:hypothetical protein